MVARPRCAGTLSGQPGLLHTPPVEPETAPGRRPFGVIVVALLQLGTVAVALVAYLSDIRLPWESVASALLAEHAWARLGVVIFGILVVVAAVGMWRLHRWGWALMITLVATSLVLDLTMWLSDATEDRQLALYLRMGFDVVSAFYLNSSSVQRAFSERKPTPRPPNASTESAGRVDP